MLFRYIFEIVKSLIKVLTFDQNSMQVYTDNCFHQNAILETQTYQILSVNIPEYY